MGANVLNYLAMQSVEKSHINSVYELMHEFSLKEDDKWPVFLFFCHVLARYYFFFTILQTFVLQQAEADMALCCVCVCTHMYVYVYVYM